MTTLLKTTVITIFATAAMLGSAVGQDLKHTDEVQTVLILNDLQAQTQSIMAAKVDSKIDNIVAKATTEMTEMPIYNTAQLNNIAIASTKRASDDMTIVMNNHIAAMLADGPKPAPFAVAMNN